MKPKGGEIHPAPWRRQGKVMFTRVEFFCSISFLLCFFLLLSLHLHLLFLLLLLLPLNTNNIKDQLPVFDPQSLLSYRFVSLLYTPLPLAGRSAFQLFHSLFCIEVRFSLVQSVCCHIKRKYRQHHTYINPYNACLNDHGALWPRGDHTGSCRDLLLSSCSLSSS